MFGNKTAMLEGSVAWKQRFHATVMDPDHVAEALEACADTHFIAGVIKRYGDLRGEITAAWCKDRLEPVRAWSNMGVTLWTPPVPKPDWGFVAVVITAHVAIAYFVVYRGPVVRSPIEIRMIASTGTRALKKIARCFVPRPSRSVETISGYRDSKILRKGSKSGLNSQTASSKMQFDINQTKFLALADKHDLLGGKKRKFAPEADKDNEEILPPLKRAKTEGSPADKEDKDLKHPRQ